MKIFRVLTAFILTIAILMACAGAMSEIRKIKGLQEQIEYLTYEISRYQKDADLLQEEIKSLNKKLNSYEQSFVFWNEQVSNMFGSQNTRYFRERSKN